MAFKRFASSEHSNGDYSDILPNGTLAWTDTAGLRLHDGTTVAGLPVNTAGIKNVFLVNAIYASEAPYAANIYDNIILVDTNAAGGDTYIAFPATNTTGKTYTVKNINAGGHTVYIVSSSGSNIIEVPADGSFNNTVSMNVSGACNVWVFDGSVYRVLSTY